MSLIPVAGEAHVGKGVEHVAADGAALDRTAHAAERLQEKDGARALPSFSTIQVVGCLAQLTPGVWELNNASEPVRVRDLHAPTADELQEALLAHFESIGQDLRARSWQPGMNPVYDFSTPNQAK